jgi:spermidine synthase
MATESGRSMTTQAQKPAAEPNEAGLVYTEWFPGATGLSFKVKEIIEDVQSEFQRIQLFETETHGKLLVMDECVMLTERDEPAYHEMIVHVPMLTHPNPQRVLVIGGGDGGTLREIVRHPEVKLARQVEIDGEVVRICKQHLPKIAAAYDHPKVDLIIGDGIKHVKETNDAQYDVVIVDSTDPFGPALGLFGEEFYSNVHRILDRDGVMVCQAESTMYGMEMLKAITSTLRGIFPLLRVYNSEIPVYPSGTWSFAFASKGPDPLHTLDPARVSVIAGGCRYWNPDIHRGSFALPTYARYELNL